MDDNDNEDLQEKRVESDGDVKEKGVEDENEEENSKKGEIFAANPSNIISQNHCHHKKIPSLIFSEAALHFPSARK